MFISLAVGSNAVSNKRLSVKILVKRLSNGGNVMEIRFNVNA